MPESRALPRPVSPWAGLLSYVVPGLGQIYQGRVGKGLLFLVCLYGLFFSGMALGNWKNVYLPDTEGKFNPWNLRPPLLANLYNRLHFLGQFWIGAAAWPAVWQYLNFDPSLEHGQTVFRDFQRTPLNENEINRLQREGDKNWDLGWVYTVIAGVLNILVIYDAFAGPAFIEGEHRHRAQRDAVAA
jgi:hypothetical protein